MKPAMDYRQIEVERRGKVAIVRLNRPRYRNAQSLRLLEEMTDAFARLDLDWEVSVIVLAGAGQDFSAGHDLGTPEQLADTESPRFGPGMEGVFAHSWHYYVENSLRWRDVKKPTIAQVQGWCIAGGFLIASCMDIIIASDDAKFLPGHSQLHTTPWDIGVRNAKRILFEHRVIHADEALRLGLASEVVPRERLEAATMAQAERWAANDPLTLRMLKQSINLAQDAMGYRTAIHAAHSNFLVQAQGSRRRREATAWRGEGPVQAALAKEKATVTLAAAPADLAGGAEPKESARGA
jgi:enoyl-CoA hydratase